MDEPVESIAVNLMQLGAPKAPDLNMCTPRPLGADCMETYVT